MKKKICIIVHSRANYGSIKAVLKEIKKSKKLELQLVVGGSAILDRFGSLVPIIKKDKFKINKKINFLIEGDSPSIMAKTTGLAIIEISNVLLDLSPDIVLTIGDRYETISTAIASSYMNIPLAHTMGGEVTGTIDESIRHAVTKFANIHFPASNLAKKNIILMGEDKKNVFKVGCPRIDGVREILNKKISNLDSYINNSGVGSKINTNKPFLTIMFHPVTTEFGEGENQILNILRSVNKFDIQKLIFWPNPDAGSDDISRGIRKWREENGDKSIRYIKNLDQEYFYHILKKTICLVGNSSSGIREGSYIGVPYVCVGSRQSGREIGKNTVFVSNSENIIFKEIQKVIKSKRKINNKDYTYGDGYAARKIVNILEKINVSSQKKLMY